MIAIDDMTIKNGCLRLCPGSTWKSNPCTVIEPETNGNPDAGGRAGAIPIEVANTFDFIDICCKSGTIVVFHDMIPHRSSVNTSPFSRRAVFLTYNPASEGDFHQQYYQKMDELRNQWREKVGLTQRQQIHEDYQKEMDALATVPK